MNREHIRALIPKADEMWGDDPPPPSAEAASLARRYLLIKPRPLRPAPRSA